MLGPSSGFKERRAGAMFDFAATVPAGQVGLWCSDSSDNTFDDFICRDVAGPYEVDGLYFSDRGNVRVDNSDNNVLETFGSSTFDRCIVRRGSRMDEYVATFKFKWNNATSPGWLARWLSPGDFYAVAIKQSDGKARLYKRVSDGTLTAVVASSTALSPG